MEGGTVPVLGVVVGGCELDLHAVDPINAVDEENEDEDEDDLHPVLELRDDGVLGDKPAPRQHIPFIYPMPPISQPCAASASKAPGIGRAGKTYVNSLRLTEKGSGMTSRPKTAISTIRMMNTYHSQRALWSRRFNWRGGERTNV